MSRHAQNERPTKENDDDDDGHPNKKARAEGAGAEESQPRRERTEKEEAFAQLSLLLMNAQDPDPFAVLGLPTNAVDVDEAAVHAARNKLALLIHPDKNNGSEESTWMMQKVEARDNALAELGLAEGSGSGGGAGGAAAGTAPAPHQRAPLMDAMELFTAVLDLDDPNNSGRDQENFKGNGVA